jgi:hypothetical protein
MGDSRGAGARAAGQTDTVGLCHIACSSNIGYLWAKRTIADPPALTLTLTAFRKKSTEQKRTILVYESGVPIRLLPSSATNVPIQIKSLAGREWTANRIA